MNLRENLQRDSIIFKHACSGPVIFSPGLNKFVFEHRTDDYTYRMIEQDCTASGLDFSLGCFNDFIAQLRGYDRQELMPWYKILPDSMVLPGEIICLNPGSDSGLSLLKVSHRNYFVVDSIDRGMLLSTLTTDENAEFESNHSLRLYPFGSVKVERVYLDVPDRISRTVDYSHSRDFNRSKVSENIAPLMQLCLQALYGNEFSTQYNFLSREFADNGISAHVIKRVAQAYLKKHHE